jgi:hypothetical protein
VLVKTTFSLEKIAPRSLWSCSLLSDCKRQSSNFLRGNILHPPPALHPRLLSSDFSRRAGRLVLVSTVTPCDAKLNSLLTDAIGLSGAAVVQNCYVAHLACCLMQCNLVLRASARLARD